MKKLLVSGVAASMFTLSMAANASPFNYIDYAVGTIDFEYGDDNGDYSSLSASFETPVVPYIYLESTEFNESDYTAIGAGAYGEVGSYSHIYGLARYVMFDDEDDEIRLTIGLRSTVTDRVEFGLEYSDFLTSDDYYDSYKVSLAYYLTENLSISGNYESSDNFDIASFAGKLSF